MLPSGYTVNKNYFLEVLHNLHWGNMKKTARTLKRQLANFAPKHNSMVLPQASFPIPCDFFLFLNIKRTFFNSQWDKSEITGWAQGHTKRGILLVFFKLKAILVQVYITGCILWRGQNKHWRVNKSCHHFLIKSHTTESHL